MRRPPPSSPFFPSRPLSGSAWGVPPTTLLPRLSARGVRGAGVRRDPRPRDPARLAAHRGARAAPTREPHRPGAALAVDPVSPSGASGVRSNRGGRLGSLQRSFGGGSGDGRFVVLRRMDGPAPQAPGPSPPF